jgi:hypothetical protein
VTKPVIESYQANGNFARTADFGSFGYANKIEFLV